LSFIAFYPSADRPVEDSPAGKDFPLRFIPGQGKDRAMEKIDPGRPS
jgi:hypothetical protein